MIVTSDNPRSEDPLAIIDEILAGAPGAEVEPDRAAAIGRAIELAGEGDVVLIAGKGHEQGQELADRTVPFDDREVAREALRRLGARRVIAAAASTSSRGSARSRRDADEITGVQVDSRRIAPGDLFVAVGAGAAFLDDARARGAAATLVPDDASAALARIGGLVRDRSSARFVGDHRLDGEDVDEGHPRRALPPARAAPSPPSRATTTRSASRSRSAALEPDTEVCILELAMRGFGQIAELCAFARPEIGVITSIGPVHLEKVGTVEGVRRAKTELVDALPPGGTAIVPADFPVGRDDLDVVRVGEDVRLEAFEPEAKAPASSPRSARSRSTSRCATSPRTCSTRSPRIARSGCRSSAPARAPPRSRSPTGATRSCRSRAAAS